MGQPRWTPRGALKLLVRPARLLPYWEVGTWSLQRP
jgi:hypothetical protein